jgi:hypothetical protein
MFGKSRQAYYQKEMHLHETGQMEVFVVELVAQVIRELPWSLISKLL